MASVTALLGAASRLAGAGRRGELAPAVDVSGGGEGLPADTTVLIGGDDPEVATDPVLAAWFARIVGLVAGDRLELGASARLGAHRVWPILTEGAGALDVTPLHDAIPAGSAWAVATRPERFFAQAADRLEARRDARGADWAARLRAPTGNLALLGRLVRTVAIALDVGSTGAVLRLRVTCASENAATQAAFALHGWRVRRGLGEGPGAAAFRASDLVRDSHRVELALPGDVATLTSLFGRG